MDATVIDPTLSGTPHIPGLASTRLGERTSNTNHNRAGTRRTPFTMGSEHGGIDPNLSMYRSSFTAGNYGIPMDASTRKAVSFFAQLVKNDCTYFYGNGDRVRPYLHKIESHAITSQVSSMDVLLPILGTTLKGAANLFYEANRTAFKSWMDFAQALITHFESPSSYIEEQLRFCSQTMLPSDSASHYFMAMKKFAATLVPPNHLAHKVIARNLTPEYQKEIDFEDVRDMNDLEQKILKVERKFRAPREFKPSRRRQPEPKEATVTCLTWPTCLKTKTTAELRKTYTH